MSIADRFAKSLAAEGRTLLGRSGRRAASQTAQKATIAGDKVLISSAARDVAKEAARPRVRIATFNMENLFPDDPQVLARAMVPAKSHEEKRALAQALRELDADVVGVQEVFDARTLREFLDQYAPDLGFKHVHVGQGTDRRGINVGIISKLPLENIRSLDHLRVPVPGQRGGDRLNRYPLQATVKHPDGYEFDAFVIHLKSSNPGPWAKIVEEAQRRGVPPETVKAEKMARAVTRREAEAQAVRDFLIQHERQNPGRNYVLLGDSNDAVGTGTYRRLMGLNDPAPDLVDALSDLPADAVTFHSKWHRSRIDVGQMSPGMAKEYVDDSAKVLTSPAAEASSDHYPPSFVIEAKDR